MLLAPSKQKPGVLLDIYNVQKAPTRKNVVVQNIDRWRSLALSWIIFPYMYFKSGLHITMI